MVLSQSCWPYYISESKTYTFFVEAQPRPTITPNPLTPTDTPTPTASNTPTLTLTPTSTFTLTPVQGVSMNITGYRGHNSGANCTTTASSPFSAGGNGDAVTFCLTLANGSQSTLSNLTLNLSFPWYFTIQVPLEGGTLQPNEQEVFAIETTIDPRWYYFEQVNGSLNGYLALSFQLLGENLSQEAMVLVDYVRQTPTPEATNNYLTATITTTPTAEPWSAFFLSSNTSPTWTPTPASGTTVTPGGAICSPATCTPTATTTLSSSVTLTPSTTQVSGTIWLDLNRNHQRETSEPLMGAIGYELWRDADQNGQAETYVSAGTSELGIYRFNLSSPASQGQLYLKFKLPEKHEFVSPNVGNDSTDSDVDNAGWYLLLSGGVLNAAPDVGIRPIANTHLTISQVQERSIAPLNSQVVFRVFVTNQGTTPLTSIQVQHTLSDGLSLVSVQTTHGTHILSQRLEKGLGVARPNLAGATVSIPSLSPGETATITLTTQVQGTVTVGRLLSSNAIASASNLAAQSANVASVMVVPNEAPNTGFSALTAIIVFSGVFLLVIGALIVRKPLYD